MELTLEQIRSITCGAISVEQEEDGIHFYRFTKEQAAVYEERAENLRKKIPAPSGIKLCFETDSENLFVRGDFQRTAARSYYSLDVKVNGQVIGSIDNFSELEVPPLYTDVKFELGQCEKNFELGKGTKAVTVYLPWNKILVLQSFCLDDGSYIKPIKPSKKLLAFGDSITQGFDAMRNYNRQIGRIAEMLDAEEFSRAVGGERFVPDLLDAPDDFQPDYIFVAYGTNDFSGLTPEKFTENCNAFFQKLEMRYPNAKVFVITPIWRADMEPPRRFSSFYDIDKGIRAATANMKNMTLVDGIDLVPHDTKYFADGRLHPNDAGFEYYFQNLWSAVQKAL